MSAAALSMLTQFGQSITVVRDVVASFDVSTGTVTEGVDATYLGYGYPSAYNSLQVDGSIIRQSDTLLLFSSTTVPLVNDIFTIGSKVLTAINIQTVSAQGVDVMYKIQLRQ
jgi:hypothetical protein